MEMVGGLSLFSTSENRGGRRGCWRSQGASVLAGQATNQAPQDAVSVGLVTWTISQNGKRPKTASSNRQTYA